MPRARVWCVHVWKPDVVYIQGPGLLLCCFFCLLLKEPRVFVWDCMPEGV